MTLYDKRLLLLTLAAVGGSACAATVHAHPGHRSGLGLHRVEAAVSPHGEWILVSGLGRVWRPDGMPRGWQPYTYGHWAATDRGAVWVSDWSWGWAAFHYGRWHRDPIVGWVWSSGDVWSPGRVPRGVRASIKRASRPRVRAPGRIARRAYRKGKKARSVQRKAGKRPGRGRKARSRSM